MPQTDACKACLALYSKEKNTLFIEIKEDESLPVLTNECNNPVRPGSAADMKMIAAAFARVVIEFFQGENREKNHWVLSMEPIEGLQFEHFTNLTMQAYIIPPHPNCPVCQRLEDKKVYIRKDAYDLMKRESADSKDVETGGVLIGHRRDSGKYVVLRVTGPGPKAIRTKARFEKDEEYCQKELTNALSQLAEKGLYLGEWHYHPVGSNEPSGLDIRSLTEIAAQSNYRIDRPIMIILSPNLECAITIHDKSGRCIQLPLEVCETI
jgi:integrative and conjugative element protein (TIGR02256 family)